MLILKFIPFHDWERPAIVYDVEGNDKLLHHVYLGDQVLNFLKDK